MSTIVVARKNGTVTIGADTLTKHGYTRQHAYLIANHSKLLKVGESFVAITGDASLNLVLADYFGRGNDVATLHLTVPARSDIRDLLSGQAVATSRHITADAARQKTMWYSRPAGRPNSVRASFQSQRSLCSR